MSATSSSVKKAIKNDALTASNASGYDIYKRLAAYATKHLKYLVFAVLGMILAGLTAPIFTLYLKTLLDGTFTEKDPNVIKWAPFIVLAIFLMRGIGSFVSSYYMQWVGRTIVKELRSELFQRLMRLPVSFYDKNNSGDLVTRLIYHAEQVSRAATKGCLLYTSPSPRDRG